MDGERLAHRRQEPAVREKDAGGSRQERGSNDHNSGFRASANFGNAFGKMTDYFSIDDILIQRGEIRLSVSGSLTAQRLVLIPQARLEMFSDLIFGLSLSISAITLIGSPAYSQASIINKVVSFIFNFIILIMIWIRYTGTMAILPVETGQIIFLNLLMLLLVGLEPYLLSIIQGALFVVNPTDLNLGMADYASSLYALDLAGLVAIQGFFTHILSKEEKGLVPSSLLHKYRVGRNAQLLLSAVFVLSALPEFWTTSALGLPLRIQLWWIPLVGSVILIVRKYGLGVLLKQEESRRG